MTDLLYGACATSLLGYLAGRPVSSVLAGPLRGVAFLFVGAAAGAGALILTGWTPPLALALGGAGAALGLLVDALVIHDALKARWSESPGPRRSFRPPRKVAPTKAPARGLESPARTPAGRTAECTPDASQNESSAEPVSVEAAIGRASSSASLRSIESPRTAPDPLRTRDTDPVSSDSPPIREPAPRLPSLSPEQVSPLSERIESFEESLSGEQTPFPSEAEERMIAEALGAARPVPRMPSDAPVPLVEMKNGVRDEELAEVRHAPREDDNDVGINLEVADAILSAPPACPACKAKNPPDARFCKACSRPLRDWTCDGCGRVNDVDAAFCITCREPVSMLASPLDVQELE